MSRWIVVALAAAGLTLAPAAYAAPVRNTQFKPFDPATVKVEAAYVMDAASGQPLFTYHADWRWPMASVTKLMTSLVYAEQDPNWDATVSLAAEDEVGGGRLRVPTGSQVSKRDLLYCSMVGSTNNTATAMARTSGLGTQGFVERMNSRARELGLTSMSFYDASGMDEKNVATAPEVAKLAVAAFSHPAVLRAAQTPSYEFMVRSSGEVKNVATTNKLLAQDRSVVVVGGKTGYLNESRNNFVAQLRPAVQPRNRKGDVVVVVFGSPTKDDSFAATKALAQWAWRTHEWPQQSQIVKR